MKKLVVVSLLLFVGILFAKAQVKPVEGELFAGLAVGASQYNTTGAIIGAELRFNLSKGKISPGFQLSQNSVGIKHTNRNERYTNLQILCDYNLNAGKKERKIYNDNQAKGLFKILSFRSKTKTEKAKMKITGIGAKKNAGAKEKREIKTKE